MWTRAVRSSFPKSGESRRIEIGFREQTVDFYRNRLARQVRSRAAAESVDSVEF